MVNVGEKRGGRYGGEHADGGVHRTLCYLLLCLGAVPMLLPVVWLLLSSVKQGDRVLTDEPEWLPWTVRHVIRHDTACRHHGPFTDHNAGKERGIGADRDMVADRGPGSPIRRALAQGILVIG